MTRIGKDTLVLSVCCFMARLYKSVKSITAKIIFSSARQRHLSKVWKAEKNSRQTLRKKRVIGFKSHQNTD